MRIVVALCVMLGVAAAAPTADRPIEDEAGVLSAADERDLAEELVAMRGTVDLAVVLVQSTGGQSIEGYARDVARRWSSGRSAAAVLVLAIGDRKSRLEVSDALRPKFPDRRAQSILDNSRGYLRSGDYAGAVRAIAAEVKAGALGQAPDLESPHPQAEGGTRVSDGDGARTSHTEVRRTTSTSYAWLIWLAVGIAVTLGIGAMWAVVQRQSSGTFTHEGYVLPRSFVADWLWCSVKVIGFVLFVIGIILAASGSSRGSTSSSSWGSSSSSSSSSSGGGGWSGGGASSSW